MEMYLGEELEQVALVIKVHQDTQSLNGIHVLFHLDRRLGQTLLQVLIIRLGDLEEINATLLENYG